jgi:hypothetical protein
MIHIRNNIKPLMWLYPKSLSFWDNKLFNMVSEPLDPLDYPLFGQSVIVESAGESREAREKHCGPMLQDHKRRRHHISIQNLKVLG